MRFQIERHLGDLRQKRLQLKTLQTARKGGLQLLEAGPGAELPPPEFSPRDYVSFLLYVDAEIEHALMVQYLYGAYSLGGSKVPPPHRQTVRGWQEIILGIAKEEMGHLISIQNVLRLIGAPLNLAREDYPWDTPFYPFPFMLEPLTLNSLAKYVYAESPANWSGPIADEVRQRVMQATPDPHHVGELFTLMIELVQDPHFVPDEIFQSNTYPFQAKWDEWGRGYHGGARGNATGANLTDTPDLLVSPLASRDDAVKVLTQIAEQGEAGPSPDNENPSHFARFLKIYMEMRALDKEGWPPARNVAINPYLLPTSPEEAAGNPVSYESRDLITNPEAKLWANLFNLRYRMVLHYLAHSFELMGGLNQAGEWTPRGTIINATFGEMYNLRAIANVLVQTPLSVHADLKMAGPPFLMPYTLNLPTSEPNRWRLHKDLLLAAKPLISQLLLKSPAAHHKYLFSLREADQNLLEVADRILVGAGTLALT